jgi:hypothetical protein
MKAFNRVDVVPFVEQCRCSGFVFDTELVLRCERAGMKRLELPTDVREHAPHPWAPARPRAFGRTTS